MKKENTRSSNRFDLNNSFPVTGDARYPILALIVLSISIVLMLLFLGNGRPVWWHYTPENLAFVKTQSVVVYRLDKTKIERVFQRLEILREFTLGRISDPVQPNRQIVPGTETFSNIDPRSLDRAINYARFIIEKLMSEGYIESLEMAKNFDTPYVYVEQENDRGAFSKVKVPIADLVARTDIRSQVDVIAQEYSDVPVSLVVSLVRNLIESNLEYNRLVKDVVESFSQKVSIYDVITVLTYVLLVTGIFFYGMMQYRTRDRVKMFAKRYYLAIVLLFVFLMMSFLIFTHLDIHGFWQILLLPTALFASLMVLLYGQSLAMRFIMYYCGIMFIVFRFDPPSCLYITLVGLSSLFAIRLGSTRIRLVLCSLVQGLCSVVVFQAIVFIFPLYAANNLSTNGFSFLAGAFSVIITSSLLPFFEFFARIPTQYFLLELSNLNVPILRRLQSIAPGTYSHSLNLATLAENACLAIGANGLLARVASYYHDIGKMEAPEYFIENQDGVNKHDKLSPKNSAKIIINHVTKGLEMGTKNRLPEEILQVIGEHHGSTLVAYFYQKALTLHQDNKGPKPHIEDFMYSGHWPQTNESAIISIADTVEAVSHTIKDPTVAQLKEKVWEIVLNKIDQGVLQDCALTMEDVYIIAEDFVLTLSGQYHARIDYPKGQESEVRNG